MARKKSKNTQHTMKQRTFIQTNGVIFVVIASVHALRVVFDWDAQFGPVTVPMSFSVVAAIVGLYLAYVAHTFTE